MLGVLLSAVADEDEGQRRQRVHQPANLLQLVPVPASRREARAAQAPVAQQQRPGGNPVQPEELVQVLVQVPRAGGHVEDGVARRAGAALAQRLVEGVHALEGQARAVLGEEERPGALEEVGDVGDDDGVVDVADDAQLGLGAGHQHGRAHVGHALGRGESSSSSTSFQPACAPAGGSTHSSRKPSSSVVPSQRWSPQRATTRARAISTVL